MYYKQASIVFFLAMVFLSSCVERDKTPYPDFDIVIDSEDSTKVHLIDKSLNADEVIYEIDCDRNNSFQFEYENDIDYFYITEDGIYRIKQYVGNEYGTSEREKYLDCDFIPDMIKITEIRINYVSNVSTYGSAWDSGTGDELPDLYFQLYFYYESSISLTSETYTNRVGFETPFSWNLNSYNFDMNKSYDFQKLILKVYDEDGYSDKLITQFELEFSDLVENNLLQDSVYFSNTLASGYFYLHWHD